jgi:uncharacterized surface protein with fasciclin (FAS1) repeats
MRNKITTFLLAGLMMVLAAAPASADEPSEATLADMILADADGRYDWKFWDYDIIGEVVAAIVADATSDTPSVETDLLAAADPNAALTAFLPDDMAFRRLAYDLTGRWIWREANIIPALLDAVGGNLQLINDIVEYHVVPLVIDSATALSSNGASLPTVQGNEIRVKVKERWWGTAIVLRDQDPDIRNARVDLRDIDNFASNGVWHGITRVMLPIDV